MPASDVIKTILLVRPGSMETNRRKKGLGLIAEFFGIINYVGTDMDWLNNSRAVSLLSLLK